MSITSKAFHILPANGYVTLRLVGSCDGSNLQDVDAQLSPYIMDPFPHFVVNCEHLSFLSKEWIRVLFGLQIKLKAVNKHVRFILVNPSIKAIFKAEGLDSSFKILTNLREALVEFGLVTKKMLDTDFINPFLTATLHVLNVQAGVTAKQSKIYLKESGENFVGDVSGIIGIVSESFNGSVVISFPEATFLKVMSGMLGEEFTELSKDIIDGAGEITNMIFGQAKIVLNEKGYGIKTAIPSVVSGKDHSLTTLTNGPTVVVPFESTAGNFFIEICISS